MFKNKYFKKIEIILFVFTIILLNCFTNISYASNSITNQEIPVKDQSVLGASLELNMENKSYLKVGQKIEIFNIYPKEGKNGNDFNVSFFNSEPRLGEGIKNNFNIKYFVSKDDFEDDSLNNIKTLNYEEIYFKSNIKIEDITVYKIEMTLKNNLNSNSKDLRVVSPFLVDKPSGEYYRDSKSLFKIYLSSDNKSLIISPVVTRLNLIMKGNTTGDIYKLIGQDKEYFVGDKFDKKDIIKIAEKNKKDVLDNVKIIYPKDIDENNITKNSGNYKLTLKLGYIEEDVNVNVKNKIYKVNLYGNKGEFNNGKDIYSLDIEDGKTIDKDIENPKRDGYDFLGWSKNNVFESVDKLLSSKDIISIKIVENTDFYAHWDISKVNINLNSNGGKFDDNEKLNIIEDIENGSKLNKEDIKTPKRNGYRFKGWTITKDKDDYFNFDNPVTKDTTLYAKWTKKSKGNSGETTPPTKPEETVNIDYVILANGAKYTDVLTATVLGNELKAPILLTKTNYMDKDTKDEIKRLNPKNIIISGGESSVSEKLVKDLKDSGINIERLSGVDRYATSVEIAKKVRSITGIKDKVTLVDGTNFPDVITISTYSSLKHAPILLTEPDNLNNDLIKIIDDFQVKYITIGGGYASVAENIELNLKENYKVDRIGGKDRYETASLIAKEVRSLTGSKDDLILVDGTNFPDGITINSLAGKYNSPIHLTNPNRLNSITKKDILDFNIKNILIGGGVNSVSENTENYLKGENIKVERISGSDRYKTAVKISEKFTEK